MLSSHVITHEVDDQFASRTPKHTFPAELCRGGMWSLSLLMYCTVEYFWILKSKLCISSTKSFKLYLIIGHFLLTSLDIFV